MKKSLFIMLCVVNVALGANKISPPSTSEGAEHAMPDNPPMIPETEYQRLFQEKQDAEAEIANMAVRIVELKRQLKQEQEKSAALQEQLERMRIWYTAAISQLKSHISDLQAQVVGLRRYIAGWTQDLHTGEWRQNGWYGWQ